MTTLAVSVFIIPLLTLVLSPYTCRGVATVLLAWADCVEELSSKFWTGIAYYGQRTGVAK